jgi:hypothetical protein
MSKINHFNFFIMRNNMAYDVGRMLTWYNLIGCWCEYIAY